jgi:hypothetical protein
MNNHHTFCAESLCTNGTGSYFLFDIDEALTVSVWTEFQLGIFAQVEKYQCFVVSLFLVYAKGFDMRGLNVQNGAAIFGKTPHWLKNVY